MVAALTRVASVARLINRFMGFSSSASVTATLGPGTYFKLN